MSLEFHLITRISFNSITVHYVTRILLLQFSCITLAKFYHNLLYYHNEIPVHYIPEFCYITGVPLSCLNSITFCDITRILLCYITGFHPVARILLHYRIPIIQSHCITLPECCHFTFLNFHFIMELHYVTLPEFFYITTFLLHYQNSV